jgi:serine/threonine protein kinase
MPPPSSAADEISGETVAIKQVTRVLDKLPLAKRALREITLLRHFANHENITGLIDLDAIGPDFNEMCVVQSSFSVSFVLNQQSRYIFLEVRRIYAGLLVADASCTL